MPSAITLFDASEELSIPCAAGLVFSKHVVPLPQLPTEIPQSAERQSMNCADGLARSQSRHRGAATLFCHISFYPQPVAAGIVATRHGLRGYGGSFRLVRWRDNVYAPISITRKSPNVLACIAENFCGADEELKIRWALPINGEIQARIELIFSADPRICRKGKHVSVILPDQDYEELLKRSEDAPDMIWLKQARRMNRCIKSPAGG